MFTKELEHKVHDMNNRLLTLGRGVERMEHEILNVRATINKMMKTNIGVLNKVGRDMTRVEDRITLLETNKKNGRTKIKSR